jgi:hypothetical protein
MPNGASRLAATAVPPSPAKPLVALPANVEMVPFGATLRIRLFEPSAM